MQIRESASCLFSDSSFLNLKSHSLRATQTHRGLRSQISLRLRVSRSENFSASSSWLLHEVGFFEVLTFYFAPVFPRRAWSRASNSATSRGAVRNRWRAVVATR